MINPSHILNARVLIVGDREADVRLLTHMLAGAGYDSVESTVRPGEVGERQRNCGFDLVVFDLPSSGAAPFQAMEALRAGGADRAPAVLAISALPAQRLRALRAGAKDFVSKPVEQLEILTRIRNVLEAHLLSVETLYQAHAVERFVQDVQDHALTDPLTELLNRRFVQEFLPREAAKAHRHATPLGVIAIDLDFFARINDGHGREAGDLVLRRVAALLKEHCRASDIACRHGGDQFSLVLPRATLDGIRHKAEEIRAAIMGLELFHRNKPLGRISASLGYAIAPEHGPGAGALLSAADVALRAAKASGRNRVMAAVPDDVAHRSSGAGSALARHSLQRIAV